MTYCLANPGVEYLVFLPAGGPEGLDRVDAPGTYRAEWFNPMTGVRTVGETLDGGKRHTVRAPLEGAAIFYLVAA